MRSRKAFYAISLILIVLALSSLACQVTVGGGGGLGEGLRGSGDVIEEEREISGVTSVVVANEGDLVIEFGDEERLVIEAEDNLMDSITSEVRNGELTLGTSPAVNLRPTKPIRYHLTIPSLEGVSTSSSGSIRVPALSADQFSIGSSSSGNISLEGLDADSLDVELSSSGDVTVGSGSVGEQTVDISSSGTYDARDLESNRARVSLSSSGSAFLNVSERLDATLSSNGDVHYWGNPEVSESTSSSGRVIRED